MTQEEAQSWIEQRFGAAALARVANFLALVMAENEHQNLIAPSTVREIWVRHALDSAQLVPIAQPGMWVDIGSGGGFPGMITAILRPDPIILVEPRRKRAAFLETCCARLEVTNAQVYAGRIEALQEAADVISARAVASVGNLLEMAAHCATRDTQWLLPRGQVDDQAVAAMRKRWKGAFHVEQSLTDPASSILVLRGTGSA